MTAKYATLSPIPLKARGDVAYFAGLMEEKLQQNDDKAGWGRCSLLWLQTKLTEEVGQLGKLLANLHAFDTGQQFQKTEDTRMSDDIEAAAWEAVDVANVAMMITSQLTDWLDRN